MQRRPCDVVVFGATGFTGSQIARTLAAAVAHDPQFHWGIADVEIIVADADDEQSIDRLVSRTRVVLNTVGPFARYGEKIVRACALHGTDYADITAETAHVRRIIDRYHDTAVETGARIVPFCGFDSVPSDIGTLLLVEHFRSMGQGTAEVKAFFRVAGGLNGGTSASTLELWRRPEDVTAMEDPYLLNPADQRAGPDKDPIAPTFDADLQRWVAPFLMGPINTRVVRRSAALSRVKYGRNFRYQEYWDPGGPAPFAVTGAAALSLAAMRVMARTPGAGALVAPFVPPPGAGPAQTAKGGFRILFIGRAEDGTKATLGIAGAGDPANNVTAKIAVECALSLVLEQPHRRSGKGGVLTPALASGHVLADRLRGAGLRITPCS